MHNIAVCSAALIAFWWVVQPIRVKAVHSSKSGASPHQEAMIMKQTFNSNNVFNIVKGQESPCVTPLCHSAWLWRGRGGLCCGLKSDCLVWFKLKCFQSLTFVEKEISLVSLQKKMDPSPPSCFTRPEYLSAQVEPICCRIIVFSNHSSHQGFLKQMEICTNTQYKWQRYVGGGHVYVKCLRFDMV